MPETTLREDGSSGRIRSPGLESVFRFPREESNERGPERFRIDTGGRG